MSAAAVAAQAKAAGRAMSRILGRRMGWSGGEEVQAVRGFSASLIRGGW
jgi:hypothetical protein